MKRQKVEKVKLFVGILTRFNQLLPLVKQRLVLDFGPIDLESGSFAFVFTTYYQEEMGAELFKTLLSFEKLIYPDEIAHCKLISQEIEEEFKSIEKSVKRPINLDPGYIELSKLVLASTKNFYHRIYLRDGIYGELTLYYKDKTYQSLPWTYPDYMSKLYQDFFYQIRGIYQGQISSK